MRRGGRKMKVKDEKKRETQTERWRDERKKGVGQRERNRDREIQTFVRWTRLERLRWTFCFIFDRSLKFRWIGWRERHVVLL